MEKLREIIKSGDVLLLSPKEYNIKKEDYTGLVVEIKDKLYIMYKDGGYDDLITALTSNHKAVMKVYRANCPQLRRSLWGNVDQVTEYFYLVWDFEACLSSRIDNLFKTPEAINKIRDISIIEQQMQNYFWKHKNGNFYKVLFLTNTKVIKSDHPVLVVYEGKDGNKWTRELKDWNRSFTLTNQKVYF